MSVKLNIKSLFGGIFFIWFISRILILTENYSFPVNGTIIQIVYICITVFLILIKCDWKIKIDYFKHKEFFKIIMILLIHTVLWGTIFVNPLIKELIIKHIMPQLMFIIIVIVTACAVVKFDAIDMFIKVSFYAISLILIIQVLRNFSDMDLSNIINIMNKDTRTRVHFGFGHYNTLGGVCLCNIILYSIIKKNNFEKIISLVCVYTSVIMLLCSASRSSLTGFILFGIIIIFQKISNAKILMNKKIVIMGLKVIIVLSLIVFSFNINLKKILIESQRSLLFYHSLPMFFKSGRVLQGLGYASNTAYGLNLTPYTTYWLDNGYIYLIISTGIVGFSLIMYVLYIFFKKFCTTKSIYIKNKIFPILCVYMYVSLFEANLFNSGSITSYIYITIFLYYVYKNNVGNQ